MTARAASLRASAIRGALGIDLALLDCLQANVAMVLHLAGVEDLLPVLGAQWWFRLAAPEAEPELEFEPEADRIERLTGLRSVQSVGPPGGIRPPCVAGLRAGILPIVVTDAYLLPWVPYARRRHIDHSFVVTDADDPCILFTDLYENRTEWGPAVPMDGALDAALVTAIDRCSRTSVNTFAAVHQAAANGEDLAAELAAANRSALADFRVGDYAAMARRHLASLAGMEALAEITWAIDRRRRLYGQWLAAASSQQLDLFPPDFAHRFRQDVEPAWSTVNRFVYLGLRRMRAGRPAGPAVAESIEVAGATEDRLRMEWLAHA
jgi:hypothetical protein